MSRNAFLSLCSENLISQDVVLKIDRMCFSIVCTLIDNDTCHHSGRNLLWTRLAVPRESTTF